MKPYKHLKVKKVDGILVVKFVAKRILDDDQEKTMEQIGAELFSLVGPQHKVLIDLRGVNYMEELALGKILSLRIKLIAQGGRIIICNARTSVFEKFDLLHSFNMRKGLTRAAALKLFSS